MQQKVDFVNFCIYTSFFFVFMTVFLFKLVTTNKYSPRSFLSVVLEY